MGIPQYYKWLVNRFNNAFGKGTPSQQKIDIQHIYVDLNCFFHNCVKKAKNNQQLVNLVMREIDGLVAGFDQKHLKSVYLAVDGPASRAKVLLQRKRRRAKQASELSLGISPGTNLMNDLCAGLTTYAEKLSRTKGLRVTISNGFVAGEGEHKMVYGMLDNELEFGEGGKHCVVGSDSDLFLIILGAPVKNVYCWDGNWKNSITYNRNAMVKNILQPLGPALPCEKESAIKSDFTLLSILKGDDYLPACVSFEGAFKAYEAHVKTLCQRQPVSDWAILRKGTNDVGEGTLIIHAYHPNMTLLKCIEKAGTVGSGKPKPAEQDYVVNYLQGLLWVVDTYANGRPLDFHYICWSTARVGGITEDEIGKWIRENRRGEYKDLRGPINVDNPLTGAPICPTTAAMCLIPAKETPKHVFGYAKVKHLLQPDADLLGPVVQFENDPLAAEYKKMLSVESQKYNKILQDIEQDPNRHKTTDRQALRQKENMQAAQTKYSNRLNEFKGSDIDEVDIAQLDSTVRSIIDNFEENVVIETFTCNGGNPKGGKKGLGKGGKVKKTTVDGTWQTVFNGVAAVQEGLDQNFHEQLNAAPSSGRQPNQDFNGDENQAAAQPMKKNKKRKNRGPQTDGQQTDGQQDGLPNDPFNVVLDEEADAEQEFNEALGIDELQEDQGEFDGEEAVFDQGGEGEADQGEDTKQADQTQQADGGQMTKSKAKRLKQRAAKERKARELELANENQSGNPFSNEKDLDGNKQNPFNNSQNQSGKSEIQWQAYPRNAPRNNNQGENTQMQNNPNRHQDWSFGVKNTHQWNNSGNSGSFRFSGELRGEIVNPLKLIPHQVTQSIANPIAKTQITNPITKTHSTPIVASSHPMSHSTPRSALHASSLSSKIVNPLRPLSRNQVSAQARALKGSNGGNSAGNENWSASAQSNKWKQYNQQNNQKNQISFTQRIHNMAPQRNQNSAQKQSSPQLGGLKIRGSGPDTTGSPSIKNPFISNPITNPISNPITSVTPSQNEVTCSNPFAESNPFEVIGSNPFASSDGLKRGRDFLDDHWPPPKKQAL